MRRRLLDLYNYFLSPIPFGLGRRFKVPFLRLAGVLIGRDCVVSPRVEIRGSGRLTIGDRVCIGRGVVIEVGVKGVVTIGNDSEINERTLLSANGGSKIHVEEGVHIAHFVSLKTATHALCPGDSSIAGDDEYKDISVGRGAWICAGSIILPGVRIGARSVVAAGAVVTKDTPEDALVCGVPAVAKKYYVGNET